MCVRGIFRKPLNVPCFLIFLRLKHGTICRYSTALIESLQTIPERLSELSQCISMYAEGRRMFTENPFSTLLSGLWKAKGDQGRDEQGECAPRYPKRSQTLSNHVHRISSVSSTLSAVAGFRGAGPVAHKVHVCCVGGPADSSCHCCSLNALPSLQHHGLQHMHAVDPDCTLHRCLLCHTPRSRHDLPF